MKNEEVIKDIINAGNYSKERMFPILNKIDRIWSENTQLQFCELVKLLIKEDEFLTDLEFTKNLDVYIDEQKIK